MSLAIGILAAALLAVQLGLAIEPRRTEPAQPAGPQQDAPIRLAVDVG